MGVPDRAHSFRALSLGDLLVEGRESSSVNDRHYDRKPRLLHRERWSPTVPSDKDRLLRLADQMRSQRASRQKLRAKPKASVVTFAVHGGAMTALQLTI